MNKIDEIQNKIKNINSISDLKDKIKTMKELKNEINEEQKKAEKLMNKINNFKSKEIFKYKKLSIDKLQKMFNNTSDFNEKIELYSQLCYKIDQIDQELFGEVKSSESEEIEFNSEGENTFTFG
mgnify:CR=1 FL=1